MKKSKSLVVISLLVILAMTVPLVGYSFLPKDAQLLINIFWDFSLSLVEIPICYSRQADKLGIQSGDVRGYILESLKPGMTSDEVEAKLSQIAPISIQETYVVESTQNTYVSVKIDLCNNPFGDMFLDTYYSKDGNLRRWEDAWSD